MCVLVLVSFVPYQIFICCVCVVCVFCVCLSVFCMCVLCVYMCVVCVWLVCACVCVSLKNTSLHLLDSTLTAYTCVGKDGQATQCVRGTPGYVAPERLVRSVGRVSPKTLS